MEPQISIMLLSSYHPLRNIPFTHHLHDRKTKRNHDFFPVSMMTQPPPRWRVIAPQQQLSAGRISPSHMAEVICVSRKNTADRLMFEGMRNVDISESGGYLICVPDFFWCWDMLMYDEADCWIQHFLWNSNSRGLIARSWRLGIEVTTNKSWGSLELLCSISMPQLFFWRTLDSSWMCNVGDAECFRQS